jgi:hypothetical protein
MAQEWIENLAQDIKQKNHEAASNYGVAQHHAAAIAEQGLPFFLTFTACLQQNIAELRAQLQGDPASCDTLLQTPTPVEIKLTRSRFPWFDADILYRDDTIILDYAKGLGIAGDPSLHRITRNFIFQPTPGETLILREAFGDSPREFQQPEDLAKYITELLFLPTPVATPNSKSGNPEK